jgi:hypothetical protein
MRRRRVLGIVAVTIDVSPERIVELRAAGKLPTDFDGLSLRRKRRCAGRWKASSRGEVVGQDVGFW